MKDEKLTEKWIKISKNFKELENMYLEYGEDIRTLENMKQYNEIIDGKEIYTMYENIINEVIWFRELLYDTLNLVKNYCDKKEAEETD